MYKGSDVYAHNPQNPLPKAVTGNTVLPMTTLSFKVSGDEARLIRALAKRERLSLSEYLRRRASGVGESTLPERVRCELTGATIFAPAAGESPLTTAAVKEMLEGIPDDIAYKVVRGNAIKMLGLDRV